MSRWSVALALSALLACACAADSSRLRNTNDARRARSRNAELQPQQQKDVDDMVAHLLQWIQGLYQQNNRKARQYFGGRPERPRPFEPATYLPPATGYPSAGSRPTPAFTDGPNPSPQPIPTQPPYQPSPSQPPQPQPTQPPYQPSPTQPPYQPSPSQPPYQPSPTQPPYQPSPTQPPYQPSPTQPPYQPSQPEQPTYQPEQPTGYPSYQPSQPTQPPYQPSPSQPSYQPSEPSKPSEETQPPYLPSQPAYQPSQPSYEPSQPSYQPSQPSPTQPPYQPSQPPQTGESASGSSSGSSVEQPISVPDDDDDRHPPHIHAITVDCGKEMMTINIEFNKPYNGIIYSQDHFNEPECVYVRENSNQVKFSFTVSLNTCGTKFYSDFENEGQAYLENVLVLQNEPGIQEVWDHIRRVRCLWEGNLTKQLVSSLSVGMLNQITSNFSGDTAMARLDIQVGRGPFAPEANGLIKIGETMTLVVSVTGDPGFDILVRECIARDSEMRQVVPLTDSNGCVLKPKLFGSFQKTRETGNTGASIIAYAFFNAFKFPDEMDLIIQCDVELCKTDCDVCPNPGSIEPRRKRRDLIHVGNRTEPVTTIGKGLRVVFAEDLPQEPSSGFCVSPAAAIWGGVLILIASLMTSVTVSFCWSRSKGSLKFGA